jgi:hypothetical protein
LIINSKRTRIFTQGNVEATPTKERFKKREAGEKDDERVPRGSYSPEEERYANANTNKAVARADVLRASARRILRHSSHNRAINDEHDTGKNIH